MSTLQIYCALFVGTALYALILSKFPKRDPDFTWVTVAIGVAIVLLAPFLDQRYNGPFTSEVYEQRVWLAFIVGGFPIAIWQISQAVRAWLNWFERIIARLEHILSRDYGDTTDPAASVAASRGQEPDEGD